MRIGLLSAWASRLGGGVFEAVVVQARLIEALGHTPIVFALADRHSKDDRNRLEGIEVQTFPVRGPRMVGYSPGLVSALQAARLDILHLHGIWMYPSRAGSRWARASGRPYVISPHGMLDRWITARGRFKKTLARLGYERRSWAAATLFHALTEDERADILHESGKRAIAVIPNAIDVKPVPASGNSDGCDPYLLSLGRIHPKKNLSGLIAGWAASSAGALGWRLVIAGWGDPADVAALESQLAETDDRSIQFIGPAFGEEKAKLLAEASFLVLPSFSEGLPMAVLEAWAFGRPTIISNGCHLPEGYACEAALETGTTVDSVRAAITRAIALPSDQRAIMGAAATRLIERRFAPKIVAAEWKSAYEDMCR